MPRRKYGHMVGPCPPTPQEKCRMCRHGRPCPVHKKDSETIQEVSKADRKRMKMKAKKR